MPPDFNAIAAAFVAALLENADARATFSAALDPVDPVAAIAVINEYASVEPPLDPTDFAPLFHHIKRLLQAAQGSGATGIPDNIMAIDPGGIGGSPAPEPPPPPPPMDGDDPTGATHNIMTPDPDDTPKGGTDQ